MRLLALGADFGRFVVNVAGGCWKRITENRSGKHLKAKCRCLEWLGKVRSG